MGLNDFTSMFEVAVTLNLAFVAVEYANSYTNLLARHVYKLHDKINDVFADCINIVDEESVNSLRGNTVDGKNTIIMVEELKRNYNKLKEEADNLKNNHLNVVNEKCHFKCFAFISLYFGLYSLTALMMAGVGSNDVSNLFWIIYSALSVLCIVVYTIFVWNDIWSTKTNSLVSCIGLFIILLGISWAIVWVIYSYNRELMNFILPSYNWVAPISSLLPFGNFVSFALIMKRRSINLYDEAKRTVEDLKPKWEKIKTDTSKLAAVNELSSNMESMVPKIKVTNMSVSVNQTMQKVGLKTQQRKGNKTK